MEQIIIIQENAYLSFSELFNILSEASRAFLSDDLFNNAYPYEKYDGYFCVNPNGTGPKFYTNPILNTLSEENYMIGKKQFYIEEYYENGELVSASPVEEYMAYECLLQITQSIYEEWIKKGSPTNLYSTLDINDFLYKIHNMGFVENKDYWTVRRADKIVACGFIPQDVALNNIITKDLSKM